MRLVLVLIVPALALALVGGAHSTPLACADACTIQAHSTAGFVAPVTEVTSGSTVVWTSLDTVGHAIGDRALVGAVEPCFVVSALPGEPSIPVRFDIVGGALYADSGDGAVACGNAQALPDGSFALKLYCIQHPTMHGALVVSA